MGVASKCYTGLDTQGRYLTDLTNDKYIRPCQIYAYGDRKSLIQLLAARFTCLFRHYLLDCWLMVQTDHNIIHRLFSFNHVEGQLLAKELENFVVFVVLVFLLLVFLVARIKMTKNCFFFCEVYCIMPLSVRQITVTSDNDDAMRDILPLQICVPPYLFHRIEDLCQA